MGGSAAERCGRGSFSGRKGLTGNRYFAGNEGLAGDAWFKKNNGSPWGEETPLRVEKERGFRSLAGKKKKKTRGGGLNMCKSKWLGKQG